MKSAPAAVFLAYSPPSSPAFYGVGKGHRALDYVKVTLENISTVQRMWFDTVFLVYISMPPCTWYVATWIDTKTWSTCILLVLPSIVDINFGHLYPTSATICPLDRVFLPPFFGGFHWMRFPCFYLRYKASQSSLVRWSGWISGLRRAPQFAL